MSIFTGNFYYVTQTDGSVIQISLTYFIGLFKYRYHTFCGIVMYCLENIRNLG